MNPTAPTAPTARRTAVPGRVPTETSPSSRRVGGSGPSSEAPPVARRVVHRNPSNTSRREEQPVSISVSISESISESVHVVVDPAVAPRAPDSSSPPEGEAREPAARCADGNGTLTPLFFSDDVHDIARAKAMCGLCARRESCLADAIDREEPWGVWGGELLSGGRIVANKRPCGRPPKRPRPEVIYDEMGPVGVVA